MSYPDARYLDENGEASGRLRRTTQGPDLVIGKDPGTQVHYLGTGESTNGAFGLYRWEMGPRPGGPQPHFHRTMTESFYVLSGSVRLYNGKEWADGNAGDFLFVPEGGIHAFRNESGEPASMLILFTPGAPREAYFEELAAIAAEERQLSPEEWTELYRRHDQYMV
ncbi:MULTISPECIES: cupin domain-containing protein [Nonomuraea]|jgi:quercetin dioxygenase-like cupin family protein|uniref:Cupin domain-containing protein n=1 Tax=Nonomuraea ferruginea TaxID=46174 RepID=A0ABT4SVZ9_9ACTN|nr:cupin domain-containing protein [Nonomuraea ferruginea]MDA0640991.1 cupin domain-containing protein [Nonomuraea ferruginea]